MGVAKSRALAAFVSVFMAMALGACVSAPQFQCSESTQCTEGGTCQASGFCSFPDSSCETGQRYSDLAGGGLKQKCVASQGQGPDAGTTIPDDALKLLSLSFSTPITASAFNPSLVDFDVDVSVLAREIRVTPTAGDAVESIRVNGGQVSSGSQSEPVTLSLGVNRINVEVSAQGKATTTYFVDVTRSAKEIEHITYAKASNTIRGAAFGDTVVISGDTLVVGSVGENRSTQGINNPATGDEKASGAVYVFRRTDGVWEEEAYIKAHNTGVLDKFGASVALDGDVLVVGAPNEDSARPGVHSSPFPSDDGGGTMDGGAVYVFRRTGATWAQEAYIKNSQVASNEFFGASVAISGDTLAVGAPSGERALGEDTGFVRTYSYIAGSWVVTPELLLATTGQPRDHFGFSISLLDNRLAVGAIFEGSSVPGIDPTPNLSGAPDSGAVYLFTRDGNGWSQEVYIKAFNPGASDFFGASVALSSDRLVVGATGEASNAAGVNSQGEDNNDNLYSGAAYVFALNGATWSQEAYLKASNSDGSDSFGTAVAVAGDRLAVGARSEDTGVAASGAVYVFRNGVGGWEQEPIVKSPTLKEGDAFGSSVSISADSLAVGAPGEDSGVTGIDMGPPDNNQVGSGAVYVFK